MAGRTRENFYKRKPGQALRGFVGLTLEEVGAYNIIIDLLYDKWRRLAYDTDADRRWLANWMGCAPQKANPIVARLIQKGRIRRLNAGGKFYLTDDVFESECADYRGQKSGEVGAKSGEVTENLPLLEPENEENQPLVVTEEKRREEKEQKERNKEKARGSRRGRGSKRTMGDSRSEVVRVKSVWTGDPRIRAAVAAENGEGFAVSYIDSATPIEGGLRTCTHYAAEKLRGVAAVKGLRIEEPP